MRAISHEPGLTKPGMTLVEMLVVVLISVVVTAAAFTLYRVNVTTYVKEDARLERDQNLRAALQAVARDARMAGNGLALLGSASQMKFMQIWTPGREEVKYNSGHALQAVPEGWFRHADAATGATGARAIFGEDGGADDPDTLTIFHSEAESGSPLGHLEAPYEGGDTLTLTGDFPEDALRPCDILALAGGGRAALLEAAGPCLNGEGEREPVKPPSKSVKVKPGGTGRFSPPDGDWKNNPILGAPPFPAGSAVYNLRNVTFVTYYLDEKNHRLMADYHDIGRNANHCADDDCEDEGDAKPGRAVVASNIDDFQVFYYYDNDTVQALDLDKDPGLSSARLDGGGGAPRRVKAVALGIVSISARDESGQPPRHVRPALFNRREGTARDRRPRNSLSEIIVLRNF